MKKYSNKWLIVSSLDGKEQRDFSVSAVARRTGYDPRTIEKWADGATIPEPARQLLAILMLGCLPYPNWTRWRLQETALLNTDTGNAYRVTSIDDGWIVRQQLSEARAEADRLHRQIAALTTQVAHLARRRPCKPWRTKAENTPRQVPLLDFFQPQKSPD